MAIILAFIFLSPVAMAKTVLYISKDNCAHSPSGCACLDGEDKLFCDRLKELGYDIIINTESDVLHPELLFDEDAEKSDMIFLGDVSKVILNKSLDQNSFCNNIASAGKIVFASFQNTYKSGDTEGCVRKLGIVSSLVENNTFNDSRIWITKTGYVTKEYEKYDPYPVYNSKQEIKIHEGNDWLSIMGTPAGMSKAYYPAVSTNDKGVFWGLDKPSDFTNISWNIFDRTVLFVMDEYIWNITTFTIPEYPMEDENFWIFTKILDRGENINSGSIKVEFDNVEKNMSWNNETGYWENRDFEGAKSNIEIKTSGGDSSKEVDPSIFEMDIVSGVYVPNVAYTIKVNVSDADEVNYKIWDSKIELKSEGELDYKDGFYQKDVVLGNWSELILEVDVFGGDDTGGIFKKIYPTELIGEGEYNITPVKWVTTAVEAGKETKEFMITAKKELKNINIFVKGVLSNYLKVDTSKTDSDIVAGGETSFKVTLDYTNLEYGAYDGRIIVEGEGLSFTIPIELNYWAVSGDYLSSDPRTWNTIISTDQTEDKVFKIINDAPFLNTKIEIEISDDVKDFISVIEKPESIEGIDKEDLKLRLDGRNMEFDEIYYGDISVDSLLGKTNISVRIEVIEDISYRFDILETKLIMWGDKINDADEWVDVDNEKELLGEINRTLADIRNTWGGKKYITAKQRLLVLETDSDRLEMLVKKLPEEKPFNFLKGLLYFVVLAVLGGVGFLFFKIFKKIKAEKKSKTKEREKEYRKGKERYRTEYY
ncbi:MAG: hypothetical protein ISS95_00370 [Candidatus Aenigmarchaeota archaeon]|nr:hypothetical protein [Candidatus Aenigmarchaeota archaeon]